MKRVLINTAAAYLPYLASGQHKTDQARAEEARQVETVTEPALPPMTRQQRRRMARKGEGS